MEFRRSDDGCICVAMEVRVFFLVWFFWVAVPSNFVPSVSVLRGRSSWCKHPAASLSSSYPLLFPLFHHVILFPNRNRKDPSSFRVSSSVYVTCVEVSFPLAWKKLLHAALQFSPRCANSPKSSKRLYHKLTKC